MFRWCVLGLALNTAHGSWLWWQKQEAVGGCDAVTRNMPGYEDFLYLGSVTCETIFNNQADLCDDPANTYGTASGEPVSIAVACCSCASSSPSPSQTASSSKSTSITPSVSPSETRTPSASPSPTSEPFYFIPAPSYLNTLSGDGAESWQPGGQFSVFGGSFGTSSDFSTTLWANGSSSFVGTLVVGAPTSRATWQLSTDIPSGDVLLGAVTVDGELSSKRITLSSLDSFGIDVAANDAFGSFVRVVGDLDGNGVNDLLVGAKFSDAPAQGAGTYFVFLLASSQDVLSIVGWLELGFSGSQTHSQFVPLADSLPEFSNRVYFTLGTDGALTDLDGDGQPEIIVGAPGCKLCYESDVSLPEGTWVFPGLISIATLNLTGGVPSTASDALLNDAVITSLDVEAFLGTLLGESAQFGYSVTTLNDVTADGLPEVLVGVPGANNGTGQLVMLSIAYDGSGASISWAHAIPPPEDLPFGARFGSSVRVVTDINNDGASELLVGCAFKELATSPSEGSGLVYLLSLNNSRSDLCNGYALYYGLELDQFVSCTDGATDDFAAGFAQALQLAGLQPSDITPLPVVPKFFVRIDSGIVPTQQNASAWQTGLATGDAFGESFAILGDINGDGQTEIAVGAPYHVGQGATDLSGSMYFLTLTAPSPSSSVTPTPSPSVTPSSSASASITSTPSITPSTTPTPSITPSGTPTPSVTPSISPTPSMTPSPTPVCGPTVLGALRCAHQADGITWPVHISASTGALTTVIGESGQATFNFTNADSVGGSLWLKTRCQNGASDSWFVNGVRWYATFSSDFVWQEVGVPTFAPQEPYLVTLSAREPNCEILAAYMGFNGRKLGGYGLRDSCGSGRARGYLCPTEMSLYRPVRYDAGVDAITSPVGLSAGQGGRAMLNFLRSESLGGGALWFYTSCLASASDSWLVNGQLWQVPHNTISDFEWHRFGVVNGSSVKLEPNEPNCAIRYAYLGYGKPNTADIPDCPVDDARLPSEAEIKGSDIAGVLEEDMYGTCAADIQLGYETSGCFAQALYSWGSNRGSLWAYMRCEQPAENAWYVNSIEWDVQPEQGYVWHEYGSLECENTLLNIRDPNCHIAMLYRGYLGLPFQKEKTCPWSRQQIYVLEGVGASYGSLQIIDRYGQRTGVSCASGFLDPTQMALDSQGNVYVADGVAGKIHRVAAGCKSTAVVAAWPRVSIGKPTALAFGDDDTQLFVADAATSSISLLTLSSAGMLTDMQATPFPAMHYRSVKYVDGTVFAAGDNKIVRWDAVNGSTEAITVAEVDPNLAIHDIEVNSNCDGLYFTVGSQVWHCNDTRNMSSCHQFCRPSEMYNGYSCLGLQDSFGLTLDCQCQLYATSNANGNVVRYDIHGSATVLNSTLVQPRDIAVLFDADIYDDRCCHTPLPTPTPTPTPPFRIESAASANRTCCSTSTEVYYAQLGGVYKMIVDPASMQATTAPLLIASFQNAHDIEIDSEGGVFVIDDLTSTIFRITPAGEKVLVAKAPEFPIQVPRSLAIGNGGLYVADIEEWKIWFLTFDENFAVVSVEDTGLPTKAVDLAVGPAGHLFVNEYGNKVSVWDAALTSSQLLFDASLGVVDVGDMTVSPCGLFFTASTNNQVWRCSNAFDSSTCARFCTLSGQDASSCVSLMNPSGIALDCSCNMFVGNLGNGKLFGYNNIDNVPTSLVSGFYMRDVEVITSATCL